MAGSVTDLIVRLLVDDKDLDKVDKSKQRFETFGNGLDAAARGSTVALGLLGGAAVLAGNAASEAEQATGAVDAVFKDHADSIKAVASNTSDAVTLMSADYNNMAAILGSQLKTLGVAQDELVPSTTNLIELGSDLSAMFGGTASEAVEAISSLLKGERDPIEKYGVSIRDATIQAEAMSLGLVKTSVDADKVSAAQARAEVAQRKYNEAVKKHGKESTEALSAQAALTSANGALDKALAGTNVELTDQQKLQATLSVLNKQTADAQGQSAREADTAAGAQARMNESIGTAVAQIGESLLPIMAEGATALADFANWAGENTDLVQSLAIGAAVLAGAILVANGAFKAFAAVQGVVTALRAIRTAQAAGAAATGVATAATTANTAATWANNAAWLASPVTWIVVAIIAAIGLLVAAAIWLWNNWDSVTKWIGEAWENTGAWLAQAGATISGWWESFWGGIGRFVTNAWMNWIVKPIRDAWVGAQKLVATGLRAIDRIWKDTWTGLGNIVRGVWNGVIGWIEGGVNSAINIINSLISGVNAVGGAFGVHIDLIPRVHIPRLATGGVTTGPMLAMIGDNPGGREYVEPVDDVAARLERVAIAAAVNARGNTGDSSRMHPDDIRDLARAIGEVVYPLIIKGSQKTFATAMGG